MQRKHPDDPAREVFEAAKSGDAVLLNEVLQELNSSERASALETKTPYSNFAVLPYHAYLTPLIVSVQNGNLDCLKVLLKYNAGIDGRGGGDIHLGIKFESYKDYTPLFVAAGCGNLDILSCLIENGADVNAGTRGNCTPLIIASKKGLVNVVNLLIEHGANVDLQDKQGRTALYYAVDSFNVLGCLIRNGVDVNARTNNNSTPLMIASANGLVNVVTFLIEHGADVKLQDRAGKTALHHAVLHSHDSCDVVSCLIENEADVNARTNSNSTPLMIASFKGHVNMVTFLIEHGAYVDLQDRHSETALHYAIHYSHNPCDVVSCLIKNGADVNKRTNDTCTPLMIASRKDDVNLVTCLLEHGANVNLHEFNCGRTALDFAVDATHNYDSCDVVSCLIKNGADVNACTNDKCTPLMIAGKKGLVNVATILLEYGANVELHDKNGKTALHHAADAYSWVVHIDNLGCLIKNGADVNARTYKNCTPLMIASENNLLSAVTFLIELGANMNLTDKDGRTALHYAVKNRGDSCDVLSCLIKNGADVNACTNDSYTPSMVASGCGNIDVVNFLIQHGANIQLQDKNGKTALHYAVNHKSASIDVLSCLIKNGADVDSCSNDNCTPLMIASSLENVNLVDFLIEHGANMDLQDTNGDTALHYAVRALGNSTEIVHKLLSVGASQLCNNQGLTPLLSASDKCNISVVEYLITRPECTKEQRIDALEFLGASLATSKVEAIVKGFKYMKRGMEERFADPSHPLLKSVEPVEADHYRKECQTLEELGQMEVDRNAIIMEGLMIRERMLGTNVELLGRIQKFANHIIHNKDHPDHPFIYVGLYNYAMKIAKRCNQSTFSDLRSLTFVHVYKIWRYVLPKQKEVLELLEQLVLKYEKQQQLEKGLKNKLLRDLFECSSLLVPFIPKFKYCEQSKILLRKLVSINPRDSNGDTLLHKVVVKEVKIINNPFDFRFTDTVKLLLNAGSNVNAVNNNGDTPLHRAVTFKPSNDEILLLTDMVEVLLDGGAHHDFVNNDGKTAMDMAETDEARMILSEKRKMELKCISARAVKKFGLPYLGMVPKTLEKYISMH